MHTISPFPSTWFRIARSIDLLPGYVKPIHYFGKDFVLFRTFEGSVHVLDAFCPHLGAHLGYGGTIQNNSIRCPYHGWQFSSTGHCVEIPYAERASKHHIHSWPVRELNGLIMMYYHPARIDPTWEIPPLEEVQSKVWTPLRLVRRWQVRTNLHHYLDNSIDVAHLSFVHHRTFQSAKTDSVEIDGPTLTHCMTQYYNQSGMVTGRLIAHQGYASTTYYGPAYDVTYYHTNILSRKGCLLQIFTGTPIDEEHLEIEIYASVKKIFPAPINWLLDVMLRADTIATFEQDLPILENKIYVQHPPFYPDDGPIPQARRWVKQFYTTSGQEEIASY